MTMNKKDYEAIARILRRRAPNFWTSAHETIADIAKDLADYFEKQNPLFNRKKFFKASRLDKL